MFRALLRWGGTSLAGHLVLSELAVALPLFILGLVVNIRAGYPTADLGWLIALPTLVGLPPGFFIWYSFTARRIRQKGRRPGKTGKTDQLNN
jgi:hypothetical protein